MADAFSHNGLIIEVDPSVPRISIDGCAVPGEQVETLLAHSQQSGVDIKTLSQLGKKIILRHPYYGPNVLPALKELVAQRGKSKRNQFYVGRVEVLEGGYESVLVYWKENRALILWEPGRGLNLQGVPDARYDLRHSRRYWDLNKDTGSHVGGCRRK